MEGPVEGGFVAELTFMEPAAELYVWRGPLVVDGGSLNCDDWSTPLGNGSFFLFEAGSGAVSLDGNAPCRSNLRLLCACEGMF